MGKPQEIHWIRTWCLKNDVTAMEKPFGGYIPFSDMPTIWYLFGLKAWYWKIRKLRKEKTLINRHDFLLPGWVTDEDCGKKKAQTNQCGHGFHSKIGSSSPKFYGKIVSFDPEIPGPWRLQPWQGRALTGQQQVPRPPRCHGGFIAGTTVAIDF